MMTIEDHFKAEKYRENLKYLKMCTYFTAAGASSQESKNIFMASSVFSHDYGRTRV
jgi:hypothetical protein